MLHVRTASTVFLSLVLALSIGSNPAGQTHASSERAIDINASLPVLERDVDLPVGRSGQREGRPSKTELQEIRLGFHPRFDTQFPIDLFMTLRGDGEVQALRYVSDRAQIIAAYKGTLSRADVRRLVLRVREAFGEYRNAPPRDENIITEGNLFYLSIKLKNGQFDQLGGKVADVPESVGKVVEDLSVFWKQLKETTPAPGYLRGFAIDKDRLQSLKRAGALRFVTLNEFPPETHRVIIDAINNSPAFKAINRSQLEKLRAQKTMVLSHNGSVYELYHFSSQR